MGVARRYFFTAAPMTALGTTLNMARQFNVLERCLQRTRSSGRG